MFKTIIVLCALFGLNNAYFLKRQINQRMCPAVNICGDGECLVTSHPSYEYQYVCKCKNGQYQFTPCSSTTVTTAGKCSTNPCYPYLCIEASSVGSGFICQCGPNDFRPNSCTTTNVCANNGGCLNGGSCIYYSSTCSWCSQVPAGQPCCVCPTGFTGTKCETAVGGTTTTGKCATNPCGSYPCVEASNFVSGYICQCGVNDFRPNACTTTSISTNGCSPNPCKNFGSCVTFDTGSFRGCICPSGYSGTYCETTSSTGTGTNTGTSTGTMSSFPCPRNGRFKDPTGCSMGKYIECVYYGSAQYPSGIAYVRDCPSSLRYNPMTDLCDYAVNVVC